MSVALGAAIAVLTGIGAGLGISFATGKAVDAIAKRLEHGAADYAEAGEQIAEARDTQRYTADGQHILRRVEKQKQHIREELEHRQSQNHQ